MGERCQGTRQVNCGPCKRHSTSPHADVPEPSSAYTFSFRSSQAIDTGTSLIYVPPALASAFYGLIPGSKRASQYGSGELSHMKGRQSLKRFPSAVHFFFFDSNRLLDCSVFFRQASRAVIRRISLRDQLQ